MANSTTSLYILKSIGKQLILSQVLTRNVTQISLEIWTFIKMTKKVLFNDLSDNRSVIPSIALNKLLNVSQLCVAIITTSNFKINTQNRDKNKTTI